MSATQFFPITPELLALACGTISKKVSRMPFLRSGVMVTEELIGVTLESLNAEPTRSLPLVTPRDAPGHIAEGLDRVLAARLKVAEKSTVQVIADVLNAAGITEPAEVLDRDMHRPRRSLRLLPAWTWHIASAATMQAHSAGVMHDGTPSLSWMSTCPVCKTGVLSRIFGKQLFGIPHTDFIIECNDCGAKLIPVGTAFRLVSIAVIRDPLWKRLLDKTFSPEEWAGIARMGGTGSVPARVPVRTRAQTPQASGAEHIPAGSLVPQKNGLLAVPVGERTLYFRPAGTRSSGGPKEGTFAKRETLLEDLLKDPAYEHLNKIVLARYSRYLPLKTGLFLSQLKERFDLFYQEFLHPYGDEKFGTFRADESPDIDKPGVLIVVINRNIYHACSCPVSFRTTINDSFGRITADLCYRTGDATRCRINAVMSAGAHKAGFFLYACSDPAERERITQSLAEDR